MKLFSFILKTCVVLITVLGVIAVLVGFILSGNYAENHDREDITVVATVIEVDHQVNHDVGDDYYVIVRHTFEGEEYTVNLGSLDESWEKKIGQQINLRIDPDNPRQTLEKARNTAFGMVLAGLFLFSSMLAFTAGVRGWAGPAFLTKKLSTHLQVNMKRFVVFWLGLFLFGLGMSVYCIVYGMLFGWLPPVLAAVSICGGLAFLIIPVAGRRSVQLKTIDKTQTM